MDLKHQAERPLWRRLLTAGLALLIALVVFVGSTLAWFAMQHMLAGYAPITKPEALYIGAGHRDITDGEFDNEHFENIRYLYFNGIDAKAGQPYFDYVFCVFGSVIAGYRLQLAYTTNNQFNYEIYRAAESTTSSEGAIAYTTHEDTPRTFYYSASGNAIAGNFLNAQTVGNETLANATLHQRTYNTYNEVNKYGEPLYWQTTGREPANLRGDFVNYYILRVYVNGKENNDRETDIICIAAKSFSS